MVGEHALEIEVNQVKKGLVVRLAGALDMANASHLLLTLGPPLDKPITLDLRGLTFLDSSGLACLIGLRNECPGGLRLIEGPRAVHKIFEVTGTASEFDWIAPPREPRRL
jgi:stage II sporulation protein AA (anti-sigma F factor antagonist)